MTQQSIKAGLSAAVALLSSMAASTAHAVGVAETPLFVSTGVTPNVMLLMDNSGSMNNIIWHSGFDPKTDYPDWARYDADSDGDVDQNWVSTDGNVFLSEVPRSLCASNYKRGQRGGKNRCLRLPDPVGSSETRYTGNYLNYLFETFGVNDGAVDLRGGQIPSTVRIAVARNVATNLINNNSNLRLGLASFNQPSGRNGGPGGRVREACGATTSALLTAAGNLAAEANTPLAETYYEVTRYFRGLSSQYNASLSYTSPIQYRCQKNFAVVVTDGFPTWDNSFPSSDPDQGSRSLPDWDGLRPETHASTYPEFPQHSDGFQGYDSGATENLEAYSLFLDDLAKFAYDTDMREGGSDAAGKSFDDPAFPAQNLSSYTVGFALSNQMLQDAAAYGHGTYYTANDEQQLTASLQDAFNDILAKTSSASAVASNSTRLSTDTTLFQARFSTADWAGSLLALPIKSDGTIGAASWDAADKIPAPGSRNILTYVPGTGGVQFQWANLNAAQQALLNKNAAGTADGLGAKRVDWIRGSRADESPAGARFRARSKVLGDIINSDPQFVGKQDFGFEKVPGEGASYKAFRAGSQYQNRSGMVYVGANDGMLHGFDAKTGTERFAYIPDSVYERLRLPTDKSFNEAHRYLLDGSPRAADAYINGAWQTLLLGTLGAGGRGVFALRVTDPDNFSSKDVLWEFSSSNDTDLGTSLPVPTIARLYDGKWAAIIGNGYNSGSQKAMLLIIDLETGALLKKIDTGVAGDNGLSSPVPVDVDGDRITDYVYAGDLKGNLWKFDLTASTASQWDVAFKQGSTPKPLFSACATIATSCSGSDHQPITARPEVSLNPRGGYVVFFGTGRYFATGDATLTSPVNSIYGIYDLNGKSESGAGAVGAGRSKLQKQEVVATKTVTLGGVTENVRATSNNTVPDTASGWYLDLPESGERQVSTPILRGGRVIMTTLTPNLDPCGFGGSSWLMELDALTGARLEYSPFDLNRDQEFNAGDFIEVNGKKVAVSGRQSKEGIIKTPTVITSDTVEYKFASGTTGGVDTTVENAAGATGRQSWRQLR